MKSPSKSFFQQTLTIIEILQNGSELKHCINQDALDISDYDIDRDIDGLDLWEFIGFFSNGQISGPDKFVLGFGILCK